MALSSTLYWTIAESFSLIGIKDIAELAGVSIGSVDRVIHNRGRFSQSTKEKVEEAIKVLNYRPNLMARQLKLGGACRIAVLQPTTSQDQGYWFVAEQGLALAKQQWSPFGVEIELVSYNRYSSESFKEAGQKILDNNFQGVLLAPLLPKDSLELIQQLPNIPIATFDCPLPGAEVLQSIYQEGYGSGATGAGLFCWHHLPQDALAVIAFSTPHPYIEQRIQGFISTLSLSGYSNPDVYYIPDDLNLEQLKVYLKQQKIQFEKYRGLFVVKTGVYKYAKLLNFNEHQSFIVGYDLTPENIQALKLGEIDIILSQNCSLQLQLGLNSLVDYILYHRQPECAVVKMPIDIITRHNVDLYLERHHGIFI